MNMGHRLKAHIDALGIKPIDLCEMVYGLDIGTLSAIYKRDSRNSKFAPAIAKALDLSLHWLLTGEGPKETKHRQDDLPETGQNRRVLRFKHQSADDETIKEVVKLMTLMNDEGKHRMLERASALAELFPANKQAASFQ